MDELAVGKYIKVETEWRGQKGIVHGVIKELSPDKRNIMLESGKIIMLDNATAAQTLVYCSDVLE